MENYDPIAIVDVGALHVWAMPYGWGGVSRAPARVKKQALAFVPPLLRFSFLEDCWTKPLPWSFVEGWCCERLREPFQGTVVQQAWQWLPRPLAKQKHPAVLPPLQSATGTSLHISELRMSTRAARWTTVARRWPPNSSWTCWPATPSEPRSGVWQFAAMRGCGSNCWASNVVVALLIRNWAYSYEMSYTKNSTLVGEEIFQQCWDLSAHWIAKLRQGKVLKSTEKDTVSCFMGGGHWSQQLQFVHFTQDSFFGFWGLRELRRPRWCGSGGLPQWPCAAREGLGGWSCFGDALMMCNQPVVTTCPSKSAAWSAWYPHHRENGKTIKCIYIYIYVLYRDHL